MMTLERINFQKLAQWQESASNNRALLRLLHESAQETLSDKVTPLALAYHQAAVAAAYQHYGFMAFAPEARRLLALAQSRQSRVSSAYLLEWLDHAAYQQLADFHLLRYLDSEPDWLDLSQEFCVSVIKRVVVCSKEEWHIAGLEHFPAELLVSLSGIIGSHMTQIQTEGARASASASLHKAQVEDGSLLDLLFPSFDLWGRALDVVLKRVAEDPLLLLSWRLEVFTTERQLKNDASLAVLTTSTREVEEQSLKIIVLISMLSGYKLGGDEAIIPETPLTLAKLVRSIEVFFEKKSESAKAIATMFNSTPSRSSLKQTVGTLIELGEQLGVFSRVAISKGQKGILLTSLAFRVTEPYSELLESTLAG